MSCFNIRCIFKNACLFYFSCFLTLSVCSAQNWQQSYGPYAGKINALFHSTSGYRFAGTDNFGIYRTSPGSDYWLPVNNGLDHLTVWCFAENQNHHMFAGTLYGGIYRSTDNGLNWNAVNEGLTSFDIRSLIMTQNGILIAGTVSAGAFRSTDDGQTWISASTGLTASMILSLSVDSLNNVFAGTAGQGVFRSADDGETWIPANQGITNFFIWSLTSRGQVTLAGSMGGGIHISTDFGQAWTPAGVSESYINALSIASNGICFAATRGKGIYKSSDRGFTWAALSHELPDSVFWSLQCDPTGKLFAGSDRLGVFTAEQPYLSWNSYGIPNVRLICLKQKNETILFSGSFKYGLFRSVNSGINWKYISLPYSNSDVNSIIFPADESILIGTQLNGILKSDSSQSQWIPINQGLPAVPVTTLHSADSVIFAGTFGKGIYRSTDSGTQWLSTTMNFQFVKNIITSADNEFFAATLGHGVYMSQDSGGTWAQVNQGLTNIFINDIASTSTGILFSATAGGGVFRSTDNGLSWHTVNQGLIDLNIRALATYESRIFAGGNILSASDNGGDSWYPFSSPDGMRNIIAISAGQSLTVATENNGIFVLQPSISISGDISRSLTSAIEIRCFPNPFNMSTAIRFFLPRNEFVEINIYNIRGEKVTSLKKGFLSNGWHETQWNGKDNRGHFCASGLYLIHLRSAQTTSVRKILMIK